MPKVREMLAGPEPANWVPNSKALYTAATSNGWPHKAVKSFIKAAFNRDSTKDLLWSEYNATMEQVSNPYED
jgi:hypothetical protein